MVYYGHPRPEDDGTIRKRVDANRPRERTGPAARVGSDASAPPSRLCDLMGESLARGRGRLRVYARKNLLEKISEIALGIVAS